MSRGLPHGRNGYRCTSVAPAGDARASIPAATATAALALATATLVVAGAPARTTTNSRRVCIKFCAGARPGRGSSSVHRSVQRERVLLHQR